MKRLTICILAFTLFAGACACAASQSTLRTKPETGVGTENDGQLKLCKHTEEREYNPSGHVKSRKATYIRYDNRIPILKNFYDVIKVLRSLIENEKISKAKSEELVQSLVSMSKSVANMPKENKNDYCPIQYGQIKQ